MANEVIHGFHVRAKKPIKELDAVLWEMEHDRTGAKLVWLDRQEENKTFCIAFQTPPTDDTGVFHILEHSVFCGSERYPVKKPFVELMKSSLNTFLNAVTFPDKTIFPFSSRNDQDFVNLLRVYMDAVLHPLIYKEPEIFAQEGWHYEVSDTGEVSYKGVVFNEMKGACSSPDSILIREAARVLFPDTCYRWTSGGDPIHIPDLTYEQFIATHKRLYHPSNSYICLDGAVDIDKVLSILDGEYLQNYKRAVPPQSIPVQPTVDGGTVETSYELSPQEELKGHVWLGLGFGTCTFQDRLELTALQALCDILCGDNQAPLRRRLVADGLAQDVCLFLNDGIRQPWLMLEARNLEEKRIAEVMDVIRDELRRLSNSGLDHRRVLATLDNLEFQMRERDTGWTPQGVVLSQTMLESWMYGGEPEANLSVGTLFDTLRRKCGEGFFELLLECVFLDNPHRCQVIMRPSHTLGEERQAREAERLRAVRDSWSAEQAGEIRAKQAHTEAWQSSHDTPEALSAMPSLRLDQIPTTPTQLPTLCETVEGLSVLRHTVPTNGIVYLNLYFTVDDLDEEELSAASFLCDLLGALDTDLCGAEELSKRIRSMFGSLQFNVEAYGGVNAPEQCRTFLCASCSVLDGKVAESVRFLTELIRGTRFEDTGKIMDLLRQRRAALTRQIDMNGPGFAMGRASAAFSAENVVLEHTAGVSYLNWLKDLEHNYLSRYLALKETLRSLAERIFTRARLTLSLTSPEGDPVKAAAAVLAERLPAGRPLQPANPSVKPWGRKREGIILPSDVSHTAVSGLFPDANLGTAKAMKRVVSLEYLWNAVRVQGGAYGVGMVLRNIGLASLYSLRDPNAARTLGCFRSIPDHLRDCGNTDIQGAIIGAVAESDPLLTPRAKGKTADSFHWRGISYEALCLTRKELLAATREDMTRYADAMGVVTEEGAVCVLGPRRQIDACGQDLDIIITI